MSFPSETPLTYISFSDSFEEHETLATLSSEEVADTLPLAPLTFTLLPLSVQVCKSVNNNLLTSNYTPSTSSSVSWIPESSSLQLAKQSKAANAIRIILIFIRFLILKGYNYSINAKEIKNLHEISRLFYSLCYFINTGLLSQPFILFVTIVVPNNLWFMYSLQWYLNNSVRSHFLIVIW